MKKIVCTLSALALLTSSISGCASIVSKSNWPVTVQSNPSGAKCVIAKENGVQLHTGETPMTITLDSSSGYFQSSKFRVTCKKEGYQDSASEFSSHLNGWYAGNIIFGGLLGILIVDPATGAMWRLSETQVVNLAQNSIPTPVVAPTVTTAPVATPAPIVAPAPVAPHELQTSSAPTTKI